MYFILGSLYYAIKCPLAPSQTSLSKSFCSLKLGFQRRIFDTSKFFLDLNFFLEQFLKQWLIGQGAGFPSWGSTVQPFGSVTLPFILLRSIKWVPGIPMDIVFKSKLSFRSGSLACSRTPFMCLKRQSLMLVRRCFDRFQLLAGLLSGP